MSEIRSFHGDYRYLSNFFIEPDGSCVEVEYQRAKCRYIDDRRLFDGITPYQAKSLGRILHQDGAVREDWFDINIDIMWFYVGKKFLDHPFLNRMLAETTPHTLIEGNNHHDMFWGVCEGHCRRSGVFVHRPIGANALGEVLMLVRDGQFPDALQGQKERLLLE